MTDSKMRSAKEILAECEAKSGGATEGERELAALCAAVEAERDDANDESKIRLQLAALADGIAEQARLCRSSYDWFEVKSAMAYEECEKRLRAILALPETPSAPDALREAFVDGAWMGRAEESLEAIEAEATRRYPTPAPREADPSRVKQVALRDRLAHWFAIEPGEWAYKQADEILALFGDGLRPPVDNPSWAQGRWFVTYIKENDQWRIDTEYGKFVAYVAPTMVAEWMKNANNEVRTPPQKPPRRWKCITCKIEGDDSEWISIHADKGHEVICSDERAAPRDPGAPAGKQREGGES